MPPVKIRGVERPRNTKKTIFRIIAYMGRFKMLWPIVFVCAVVSALAGVAGTYLLKPALNEYIVPFITRKNPPLSGFLHLIETLLVIYVCGAFASYFTHRLLVHISTGTLCNIRKDLFNHMETLPIKYFDGRTHGVLMSLYTNDTDTLRDMFNQTIPQMMTGALQVTGVFIMMIVLSLRLTLVIIVTISLMLLLASHIGKLSAKAYREQQDHIGHVNGYIEELVEGLRVVKVFTREDASCARFAELNDDLCESGTAASTYASILGPIMNNLSHFQYAIVAALGSFFVISGSSDIGTIAGFLQSVRSFSQPLSQISQQINSVLNALAGAERIFTAMSEQSESNYGKVSLVNAYYTRADAASDKESHLTESFAPTGQWAWKTSVANHLNLKPMKGEIVFDAVDFSYDGVLKVLKNINISAKPGQKIALVGSTGSGKTTITNLLTRFYDVREGSITYDGIPIADIDKRHLRRSLGMVLQDTHLFTGTISDNIRYGNPDASEAQILAAARLANADSFIKHLPQGYQTVITGDGASLSQGQRQLLAIARAAAANPPVLILDEATSSIDTRTEALIEKGMDRLMRGRTVFVIAHRLSTVRNADCIIVLERGNIIERGTHDFLMQSKGRYYQLYTGASRLE